jgi:hypothetical protein
MTMAHAVAPQPWLPAVGPGAATGRLRITRLSPAAGQPLSEPICRHIKNIRLFVRLLSQFRLIALK